MGLRNNEMDNNNNKARNNKNNKAVLDTSALMALFNDEEGSDTVYMMLPHALISAVNLCEVVSKAAEKGISAALIFEHLKTLELQVAAFDLEQSQVAANLHFDKGQSYTFSEKACIALAVSLDLPIYTAEKNLAKLDLPVKVHLIR